MAFGFDPVFRTLTLWEAVVSNTYVAIRMKSRSPWPEGRLEPTPLRVRSASRYAPRVSVEGTFDGRKLE